LRHAGNTEIEPSAVVVTLQKGRGISRHPEIKTVLAIAPHRLCQVARAELRAEHDLAVGDVPASPLWVSLKQLRVVRRFEVQWFVFGNFFHLEESGLLTEVQLNVILYQLCVFCFPLAEIVVVKRLQRLLFLFALDFFVFFGGFD